MQDLEPKPVILLIADISGYTQFMLSHQKALVHSQMVVSELINTIVESVGPCLEVAKLEGDAVFMFAVKDRAGLFDCRGCGLLVAILDRLSGDPYRCTGGAPMHQVPLRSHERLAVALLRRLRMCQIDLLREPGRHVCAATTAW